MTAAAGRDSGGDMTLSLCAAAAWRVMASKSWRRQPSLRSAPRARGVAAKYRK